MLNPDSPVWDFDLELDFDDLHKVGRESVDSHDWASTTTFSGESTSEPDSDVDSEYSIPESVELIIEELLVAGDNDLAMDSIEDGMNWEVTSFWNSCFKDDDNRIFGQVESAVDAVNLLASEGNLNEVIKKPVNMRSHGQDSHDIDRSSLNTEPPILVSKEDVAGRKATTTATKKRRRDDTKENEVAGEHRAKKCKYGQSL